MDLEKLTGMQLSALAEIGNIGSGNAATALSKMINHRITLKVPNIRVMEFNEVSSVVGGPEQPVCGVYLPVEGESEAHILILLTPEASKSLVEVLMPGFEHNSIFEMSEMEISAIKEVGNILTSSYICALTDLTKIAMYPGVPSLAIDMAGSILDVFMIEFSMVSDQILLIETEMHYADDVFDCYFFLLPCEGMLESMLTALGVG